MAAVQSIGATVFTIINNYGWNIQNVVYDTVSLVASDVPATQAGMEWSGDGKTLYVFKTGSGVSVIYQYTVSTAWDLSTAVYASKNKNISSPNSDLVAISFRTDGTKMYALDSTNHKVYEYLLSTPWDITTAVYNSVSFNTVTQTSNPWATTFKPDGKKMYLVDATTKIIYQYSLANAWDLSTVSYDSLSFTATETTSPEGMAFKPDGTKLYVMSAGAVNAFQYTLSTPWDISTATYGGLTYIQLQGTSNKQIRFNDTGTKMYSYSAATNTVYEYLVNIPWYISLNKLNVQFSVNSENASPRGLAFSSDGTKAFMLGQFNPNQRVYQYTLSTAWDLSTIAYSSSSFLVSSQDTAPTGIFFKTDGTKMYITGDTNNSVFQYTLATPWNISSASYDSVSFSVAGQDTTPVDLSFSLDGSKMYVIGNQNDKVYQYDLGTPWNVSTAVYNSVSLSIIPTSPSGMFFKPDGTTLYVMNGDTSNPAARTYQYNLSTIWDISTATSAGLSFLNQDNTAQAVFFKSDGKRIFTLGGTSVNINEILSGDPTQV